MYNLVIYIPETHLEQVKNALFLKGAGRMGDYDSCAWQTEGTGQYRPLENSHPFLGSRGKNSTVKEFRVEMICHDDILKDVLIELKRVHPYEEPAYHVYKITTLDDLS